MSSISAKATTMSAKSSQHKNQIVRNQQSWRLKISIPMTKNSNNDCWITQHSRKTRWNFHRLYYLIRFLKTWTRKTVLYFWKKIISGIVSQVQHYALILSNILDEKWRARLIISANTQYSACTRRTSSARRAWNWGLIRPRNSFSADTRICCC